MVTVSPVCMGMPSLSCTSSYILLGKSVGDISDRLVTFVPVMVYFRREESLKRLGERNGH